MKALPCLRVLDEGGAGDEVQPVRCGQPSALHALGNEARYGHVCRECWEAFDEEEQEWYGEPELTDEGASNPDYWGGGRFE